MKDLLMEQLVLDGWMDAGRLYAELLEMKRMREEDEGRTGVMGLPSLCLPAGLWQGGAEFTISRNNMEQIESI